MTVTFALTRFFGLSAVLIAGATADAAAAADFKDFRDWYVGCDNLRNCSAYGFEAGDGPSAAWIRIERSGAPAATARITLAADVSDKVKVQLAFDDAALPGLPAGPVAPDKDGDDDTVFARVVIDDPGAVDVVVAGMRKAQAIVIHRVDPPGGAKSDPETSRISLSGAVAALLWIDEQQQRLGTTTAFIRRGDRPASSIPLQPKAPAVQAAKPQAGAPRTLPPSEARVVTAKARELCNDDERARLDDSWRLSRDTSLLGFSCPGISGAYNYASVFLIAPDGRPQAARSVKFVYPPGVAKGAAAAGEEVVAMNAGFDQSTMTLSTFDKGRGIADCGAAEEWTFDGQTFQLTLLKAMGHCSGVGSDDWPVHWQAEVK